MNENVAQLVGRTLGQRYRLERPIGAGGMGAVFEATQLDLGRTVAVKVLLDVDPRGIARLKQEALTAGSLSCPHVVSIFDFQAPAGEPPFIVMELLPGHSLAKLLKHERALAVPRAARIAAQMLIGLEAAHHAGVIHRDVKPSNTWLVFGPGIDEHVKMLDFGIAKMLGGDGPGLHTTTGSVVGTPAYLAPEQLRGLAFDARVDIHAMGIVLFEMLTGSKPWRSDTASIYAEILERQPPPVHTLSPNVPPGLSQIVQRALAKDPAARFARASDMRAALEPFVGAVPSMPPTIMGGLGAGTGTWGSAHGPASTPLVHAAPPPSTLGSLPPAWSGVPPTLGGVPPTLGMVPPTVEARPSFAPMHVTTHATTHVPYARTNPYGAQATYASAANPPARSSSFALPFLLGGGVVVLGGGAILAAFLLGRVQATDASAATTADAGAAATSHGANAAAAATAAATPDAGGARVASAGGAPAGVTKKAGTPQSAAGATPAAGAAAAPAGAAAAIPATSARCECVNRNGGTVCTVPKIPNCACEPLDHIGTSLCPKPFSADSTCPVSGPNGLLPYSGPGVTNGKSCSGFLLVDNGKSSRATGLTQCQFCYGRDKFAQVEGTACRGMDTLGDTVDGKWVCER